MYNVHNSLIFLNIFFCGNIFEKTNKITNENRSFTFMAIDKKNLPSDNVEGKIKTIKDPSLRVNKMSMIPTLTV